jgi:two-component system cell cycle sensor histidine kinase/response regulator CckA
MISQEKPQDPLPQSLSFYDDLFANIPSGIYRFRMRALGGWAFDFVSSRFCELTGLNLEEILNDCEAVFRLIHPDDRTTFISLNESVEKSLGPFMWDGRAIVNGEPRWAHVESRPVCMTNGDVVWNGIVTDITERKLIEDALRESEERYRSLVEHLPQRIFIKDRNSVYLSCNKIYASDLGITPEEIAGNDDFAFYPPELAKAYRTSDQACMATSLVTDTIAPYQYDGQERWVHSFKVPYHNSQGQIIGVLGIFEDITDRKRLEEERLEVERKLLHAQKLESLNIMAGGIAHDFNNQLAIVLGNLELALSDRTLVPEVKHSIKSAVEAAKRSAELSRQMQIYTGNTLYYSVELDLKELLTEKPSLLKLCVSRNVTLNLDIYKTLPSIKGDADQLQRLVTNILVNASEAIGDKNGDVTLRTGVMDCDEAYLRRSRLEEKPAPGWFVFLEVTDTGCGMDSETQLRLFDPFFTTKFWGRGLGMAEVMGIVKSHHGTIIIDSEVGKGTTIRVLFPASEKAQAPSDRAMDIVASKTEQDSVTGRKIILFVEDDPGLRSLGIKRLERLGYGSIVAGDGEECINVFRERLNEIDLVMLDYKMPKMDGAEAFEELLRIKPDVKVILCSGYAEDVVMRSFPGQLPAGVLHKPYNMEALKGELDRVLVTTG